MRHKARKREQFYKKALDGSLNWEYMVSRYVWDSEKTPYFTKISSLNGKQARSEIIFFAAMIGIAAFVLMFVLATKGLDGQGANQLAALYCFIVVCGALTLGILKEPAAAIVCSTFPVMGLLRLMFHGKFSSAHGTFESVLIGVIFALIAVYSYRLISITRNLHYGEYEDDEAGGD